MKTMIVALVFYAFSVASFVVPIGQAATPNNGSEKQKSIKELFAVPADYKPPSDTLKKEERVNIKGLKIGLSEKEVEVIINGNLYNHPGFSIGGVTGKSGDMHPLIFSWKDKKVVGFFFKFDPADFDTLLASVKGKYPQVGCKNSEVSTAMGVKFIQISCTTTIGDDRIRVDKYGGNITESRLSVFSMDYLIEEGIKRDKKKSDI